MNENQDDIKLPRDRATINAWARSWYFTNSQVWKQVEELKTKILQVLNLSNININIDFDLLVRDYIIIGESFITKKDSKWIFLNPDYVIVKNNYTNLFYELRPDENLRRMVLNNDPLDIDNEIIFLIKTGKNIPLKNTYHLLNQVWHGEARGSSLLIPFFKQFMCKDFLFLPKGDVYQNMIDKHSKNIQEFISNF